MRQYVYFAIKSDELSPEQIESLVGLAADRVLIAGSKSTEPLRPAANTWEVVCDEPGLTVDDQISRVVTRVAPVKNAISELVRSGRAVAVLQVVRYFNEENSEPEDLSSPVPGLRKLPWQHQLLGWSLDDANIEFLREVGANLDVDEYG